MLPLGLNLEQAIDQAHEEGTMVKALSFLSVWETERVVVQARNNPQWETCFETIFKTYFKKYPLMVH